MLENLNPYQVVLASNSPRRKELMKRLGVPFKVRTLLGVDESYPDTLQGEDISRYISRKKAEAYRSSMAPMNCLLRLILSCRLKARFLASLAMLTMPNVCFICFRDVSTR